MVHRSSLVSLPIPLSFFLSCNGRALDRVTTQKHRPNRQKLSKKCPKIVFSAPPDNFWTFFGHFFDIFRTFCRHSPFLGCPTLCPLQFLSARKVEKEAKNGRLIVARLAILRGWYRAPKLPKPGNTEKITRKKYRIPHLSQESTPKNTEKIPKKKKTRKSGIF